MSLISETPDGLITYLALHYVSIQNHLYCVVSSKWDSLLQLIDTFSSVFSMQ